MLFRCFFVSLNRRTSCAKSFSSSHCNDHGKKEVTEQRLNELCSLLGCSPATARLMIPGNVKITNIDSHEFLNNLKFCKKNFRLNHIYCNPVILTLPHSVLRHRYQTLKEFGCDRIHPSYVLNFQKIMQETPISVQKYGVSLQPKNVLHEVLNSIKASEEEKQVLKSRLSEINLKNSKLFTIKTKLTSEFLMWRMQQKDSMVKLVTRCPLLLCTSIYDLESKIKILTLDYGFTPKQIISKPFLLSLPCSHLKVFESVPSVLGIPTVELMRKMPYLLRKSPSNLQKMIHTLLEYGITESQLRLLPKVLHLGPFVLKQRLEYLYKNKSLSSLKNDKRYLKLLFHSSKLERRIQSLDMSSLPLSISMLIASESAFRKKLRSPKQYRVHSEEIITHLSDMYGCSAEKICSVLSRYPESCSSPANMHNVIDFLNSRGVSKLQLWNGLGIVAYDVKIVEIYFNQLPQFPELQPFSESVKHFNFVQFLIYAIDRHAKHIATCSTVFHSGAAEDATPNKVFQAMEFNDHEDGFSDDDSFDSLSESEPYLLSDEETELSDAYVN